MKGILYMIKKVYLPVVCSQYLQSVGCYESILLCK